MATAQVAEEMPHVVAVPDNTLKDVTDKQRDGGDGLETRGDGLETRGDGLETRGDGLETRGDGLETRKDGLETRKDGLETRGDGVKTRGVGRRRRLSRKISVGSSGSVDNFGSVHSGDEIYSRKKRNVYVMYVLASSAQALFNKSLLKNTGVDPLVMTAFQQLFILTLFAVKKQMRRNSSGKMRMRLTKRIWSWRKIKKYAHLGGVLTAMVYMNNLALALGTMSDYVVARSTNLLWNLLISRILLKHKTTLKQKLCSATIITSLLATLPPNAFRTLNTLGTFAGVLSSAAQAVFAALISKSIFNSSADTETAGDTAKETEKLTKGEQAQEILGHYTVVSATLLTAAAIFKCGMPWGKLTLSAAMNLLVTITSMHSLACSDPITVTVLGCAKGFGQAAYGTLACGEVLTPVKAAALVATLTATTAYAVDKL